MKEKNWNFTFTESFLKTLKDVHRIQFPASALAMSQTWKTVVPNYKISGAYAALNEIAANHREWKKIAIQPNSFSAMMKDVLPVVKFDTQGIALSALAAIDTSALTTLRESVSVAALEKADWSWLSEAYAGKIGDVRDTGTSDPAKTVVTEEIRAEMAEDINQILSEPDTMSLASQSKYLQWKDRNPGFAAFFLEILFPVLLLIAGWGFDCWQARLTKDARVYEEPVATSNVVYNITVENHVTVIVDVPYYYAVEFPHPETGELVTGYIPKRNLIADESNETEEQHRTETTGVPEATEVSETVPDVTVGRMESTD